MRRIVGRCGWTATKSRVVSRLQRRALRFNNNASVRVGTTVTTSVRVVAVPPPLIKIHPEWRGHMYFVVGDQIIVVDRNHRIIAIINV